MHNLNEEKTESGKDAFEGPVGSHAEIQTFFCVRSEALNMTVQTDRIARVDDTKDIDKYDSSQNDKISKIAVTAEIGEYDSSEDNS